MNADTEQMDEVTVNLYNHLCSLLYQRDFYIRVSIEAVPVSVTFIVIYCFHDCRYFCFFSVSVFQNKVLSCSRT